jgi:hypothetical protein
MQLNLAFMSPATDAAPVVADTPWHKLDLADQARALHILARLIAKMLGAAPARETHHE